MKKNIIIIFLIIIICALVGLLIFKQPIFNENKVYDENGKSVDLPKIKLSYITHVMTTAKDANSNTTIIYTFDESDLLISTRYIVEFSNEEEARKYYDNEKQNSIITKMTIDGKKVKYTQSASNGATKDRVLESAKQAGMGEIIEY